MRRASCALLFAALLFTIVLHPLTARAATVPQANVALESFESGMLHVDRYGRGNSTLVFIPGLAGGEWTWRAIVARFQRDHTIYVLTLPGFDGRPAVNATPLFAAFAHDFWSLLETRHIDKPVVIGHSLGGTLAIALAEEHAERLRAIVAVDGLPIFPTTVQMTNEQRTAAAAQFASSIASQSVAQFRASQLAYMRSIGTLDPSLASDLAALSAKSDPRAVAAWAQEDLATDLRPGLGRITIPFTEIMPWAPSNPYTQAQTQAFYTALLAGAPTARVVPIAPSLHFVMFDQPEAFATLVRLAIRSRVRTAST